MINFFKIIRWKNLLIIAITQILIKYALLEPFVEPLNVAITLNWFGFSLLVLATVCIAAAGYVINDVYDIQTDTINDPDNVIVGKHISEKNATYIFIFLTIFGVGVGFYLSNLVGHSGFASLFVVVSALLYVYASSLKKMIIIGNVVISILVALSLIMVGVFELLPNITAENQETQVTFFKIILDYALFGFTINFIREIAKDIEDIDGDFNAGARTLPIIIGRERSGKVVFALLFVPIVGLIYYVTTYLYKHQVAIIYFLVFIIAPLIYICVKSYSAETKKDWGHISNLLKVVMLTGILSLVLYKYILLN